MPTTLSNLQMVPEPEPAQQAHTAVCTASYSTCSSMLRAPVIQIICFATETEKLPHGAGGTVRLAVTFHNVSAEKQHVTSELQQWITYQSCVSSLYSVGLS
jgi:hypothetical protein